MMQIPDFFLIPHKWYATIGSLLKNMSLKLCILHDPLREFQNFMLWTEIQNFCFFRCLCAHTLKIINVQLWNFFIGPIS